jgi:hypothetical protein
VKMVNELYDSLIPHIVQHGFKCLDGSVTHNSPVDVSHAVISHLYGPERYFIFLYGKSFLIRKYDDNHETRENRRSVSLI